MENPESVPDEPEYAPVTNEANSNEPAEVTIPINNEAVASAVVEVGTTGAKEMGGQLQEDYDNSTKTQSDQHERPPPPPYCIKLMNWFPLRLFAFLGGIALFVACIIDTIFSSSVESALSPLC